MRTLSGDLVRNLVQNYSHAAGDHYDPATTMGCQRESFSDLGFGWIYWALARVIKPRKVLVIGSGRGFSVACFALGIEDCVGAKVIFVDPGYQSWQVEHTQDVADGMWQTAGQAADHFATHLGLDNIQFLRLRSDEAFQRFRDGGDKFDLIFIDGEHSYQQALADLRNATECLNSSGIILAHDTCCAHWPGVTMALAALCLEAPWLECLSLPCFPGLSLIKNREPLVQLRPVSQRENEQINVWRAAADVNTRPLSQGDDPRPGIQATDPREGLFGVFEGDRLIGGFGVRSRIFDGEGVDNFHADCGQLLAGHLIYGVVLQPESRGQRRWQMVICELLRWFRDEGLYAITRYPQRGREAPFVTTRVGACGDYMAFQYRLRNVSDWRAAACDFPNPALRLAQKQTDDKDIAAQRQEICALQAELHRVLSSRSWRWTRPGRVLGKWVRIAKKGFAGLVNLLPMSFSVRR